ncbi:Atu1372/SO_1960 family protein [Streptomyces sp. SID8352]|uniref:Atu1372/SO_1960 family protein n=1 Tax=Streptomyces sp. SID8352 TaxID=2690338 RepID=UPI0013721F06|nr:helix-turn-helix domain-containing protein [Streptomyces sp. SID8352]
MSQKSAAPVTSRTAERIVDLLTLLGNADTPLTALEIAAACNAPKSSTHQLLNYLATRNFVRYDPVRRTWALGVALFELGAAYHRGSPLEEIGRGILIEVCQATSATSHLAVRDGTEVLYIDKQQQRNGSAMTQLVTETGIRLPAHLTAVGRALLATLSDEELHDLYHHYPFPRRTALGPQTASELIEDLGRVRELGYALESGLTTAGITCIAAAVYDDETQPVAALGITFVTDQMSPAQVAKQARTVREFAGKLSHELGWRPIEEGPVHPESITFADSTRSWTLPPPARPAGRYQEITRSGKLLATSGHGPVDGPGVATVGTLGLDLSVEQGRAAAESTMLLVLASLHEELGSLELVEQVLHVQVFVRSTPDFTEHPAVADGASAALVGVLGPDRGAHSRTAIGVASLPFGIPVEIHLTATTREAGQ